MIEIHEMRSLMFNLELLRQKDSFEKVDILDCLDEIFAILLKMNKMEIRTHDYSYDTYIVKESEE